MTTYTILFSEEALIDTKSAYDWYEDQLEGLGERFYRKLKTTYNKLQKHPNLAQVLDRNVRYLPIATFPYGIFYIVEHDKIHIIRILHQHRHPDTWKKTKEK